MKPWLDDGIVVLEVKKGVFRMERATRVLKQKIGDDGMVGLQSFMEETSREWKGDVLTVAGDQFERKLEVELGVFRLELAKELAEVRIDMAKQLAIIRTDMAKEISGVRTETAGLRADMITLASATRTDVLKWAFLFWIGQCATMAILLR